jgi:hypothetical protein
LAIPVLLILAVLWAAVLVPPVLRSRSESRRRGLVGDFGSGPGSIAGRHSSSRSKGKAAGRSLYAVPALRPDSARPGGPAGHPARGPRVDRRVNRLIASGAPAPLSPAQRRRRRVLITLASAAMATLLLALVVGSSLVWFVHALIDAMLVVFVLLLIRLKHRSLASFQKSMDAWPTPPRGTRAVSVDHPPVPPRPDLAPLTPDRPSLRRAAAR